MKILFDLFPILMFFGVFRIAEMNEQGSFRLATLLVGSFVSGAGLLPDQGPIMLATVAAIVASVLQISYLKVRGRKVDIMLWVSFSVITIFGCATIYFHNDTFIKWKPTMIYWLQAGGMLVAQLFFGKNLVREVMEAQIKLPDPIWDKLSKAWIIFFFAVGGLNLLAAFVLFKGDTHAWVSFKTFALTGLLFGFIVLQTLYLSKFMEEETEEKA